MNWYATVTISSNICTITCGKINRLSNFSHPIRGGEGQPRIETTLKREKSRPYRERAHKPNRGGMRPNPGAYARGSYNLKPRLKDANFCFRSLRHPKVEEGKQNSALGRVSKFCLRSGIYAEKIGVYDFQRCKKNHTQNARHAKG